MFLGGLILGGVLKQVDRICGRVLIIRALQVQVGCDWSVIVHGVLRLKSIVYNEVFERFF